MSGTETYHHVKFRANRCHRRRDICNRREKKTATNNSIHFHTNVECFRCVHTGTISLWLTLLFTVSVVNTYFVYHDSVVVVVVDRCLCMSSTSLAWRQRQHSARDGRLSRYYTIRFSCQSAALIWDDGRRVKAIRFCGTVPLVHNGRPSVNYSWLRRYIATCLSPYNYLCYNHERLACDLSKQKAQLSLTLTNRAIDDKPRDAGL